MDARGIHAYARSLAFAITLPDGRIIVVGGQGLSDNAVNAAEIYTPASNSWMSAPRCKRLTMVAWQPRW